MPVTITARAMLVSQMLRLMRGRASLPGIRGRMTSAQIGPMPNITSGLRNRR